MVNSAVQANQRTQNAPCFYVNAWYAALVVLCVDALISCLPDLTTATTKPNRAGDRQQQQATVYIHPPTVNN